MNKTVYLVGATSTGKSDLGIKIAKHFNGEIISADSRQIFKGIDYNSGKITKEEMQGVPHHMLDVVPPQTEYSAYQYQKDALPLIKQIHKKGKLPLIVGGSGFYIKALLFDGLIPQLEPNKELRGELQNKSIEELQNQLKNYDTEVGLQVDVNNKRKLIRAIELFEALKEIPNPSLIKRFCSYGVGLRLPKEELYEKIEKRLEVRFPKMKEEIIRLHQDGVSLSWMSDVGLELRYMAKLIKGEDEEKIKEELLSQIKKYAKRQMVWFNKDTNIKWFHPDDMDEIFTYIEKCLVK